MLFGTFSLGTVLLAGSMVGSVLTFNQDVVIRKENGLLFCYFCERQMDPKAKSTTQKRLDDKQILAGFECGSCHLVNYFPIPPDQSIRAKIGNLPYGDLKDKIVKQF